MKVSRKTVWFLGVGLLGVSTWAFFNTRTNSEETGTVSMSSKRPRYAARYTAEGKLMRPDGWREWVFVGTPVTPNDMNNGKAAFPEFHNVYIDPPSYAVFRKTGKFPDGTQMVKELVSVGTKSASSGKGYFQGEFQGLEVAVNDSKRFKDEPGGWAFFSFGHSPPYAETAKKFPAAMCNTCHGANAATEYVFTQYYPVLRAATKNSQPGNHNE